MKTRNHEEIRQSVRQVYGDIAKRKGGGCGCAPSCCSGGQTISPQNASEKLGYSKEELRSAPQGSNMGLGCGNPQAMAALKPGETVLDLGSGGGFDCFLAANQVGSAGKVIGVDMTADMVSKARKNAVKGGYENVEFRLGEIEHLPVADGEVDVIISNCVVNLSPDKAAVYRDAYRVLKPGGRLAISDIVAVSELPAEVRNDLALHAGCIAGAATIDTLEQMLTGAGFQNINIRLNAKSRETIKELAQGQSFADYIASASIEAVKPN